ncbi:MAG: hypothetical protein ACE5G8_04605, partial [Anaerolineae bacterium]
SIRRRGILPDIAVELSPGEFPLFPGDMDVLTEEELFHTGDAQLLEAIKQLNHCWDRRGCE